MKLIKVGAAVLNQTPLDWIGNTARIAAAIAEARKGNVSLLCCPELCISGYGCEDAFYSPDLAERSLRALKLLQPETKGMIVAVGLPIRYQNSLFNCACLLVDGEIAGFVGKQNLAGGGIYYESRWFKPWPSDTRVELSVDGKEYPLGDIYFQFGDLSLGFEICEDAWVAKRPGSELSLRGVDIILNPSASHFAFGKFDIRKRFVLEGSRAFGVTYIYSNLLGNESGRAIYDGGALIACAGELVGQGSRFSFKDSVVTSAVVDIERTRTQQTRIGSFRPEVEAVDSRVVQIPFTFPVISPQVNPQQIAAWENSSELKKEEFARAEALALFDYLRKSRLKGFVISLSGGADSSTVAALVALMAHLANQELGTKTFKEKLRLEPKLNTLPEILKSILLCVYQKSENSSETTFTAAREVAQAIGAEFVSLDISHLVREYSTLGESAIGRKLSWSEDDLALQNIQARTRAPSAWLIANLRQSLLLVTSNRSEAAVGYATMDGDTAGSLSPLGGIDKAFIRIWLKWMETTGPDAAFPLPALSFVNAQQPTAELRPASNKQTDETDLMPYEFLDLVERAALLDRQSPLEILRRMQVQCPSIAATQLAAWIEKFFILWCRNQWKRERYAPAFHLDDESLDPKTWCRFPILSGGYEQELADMRDYIASLGNVK